MTLHLRFNDDGSAGPSTKPLSVAVDDDGNATVCYGGGSLGSTVLKAFDYDDSSTMASLPSALPGPIAVTGVERCEIDVRFDGKASMLATDGNKRGYLYEDHQTPSGWSFTSTQLLTSGGSSQFFENPRLQRDPDVDGSSTYNASVFWGFSPTNTSYPTMAWRLSPFDLTPTSEGLVPGTSLRGLRFERNDLGVGYVMRDYETGVGFGSAMDFAALSPTDNLTTSIVLNDCTMNDATGWIDQFDMRVEERTSVGWYACVFRDTVNSFTELRVGELSPSGSTTLASRSLAGVNLPLVRVVVQPDREADAPGINGAIFINDSGGLDYVLLEDPGDTNYASYGGTLAAGTGIRSFDAALDANGDLLLLYSSGAGTGADPRVVTFAEFRWVPPLLGPSPINTQDLATFATADSRTSLKLDVTPSGEAALIYVGGDGGLDFVTYGP